MSCPARKPSIEPAAVNASGLPGAPCPTCAGAHFWRSRGGWYCSGCRPCPEESAHKVETLTLPGGPPAAVYYDVPEGRVFSLRSREGGLDVSKIAVRYGGGGHPNAAGFRLPHGVDPALGEGLVDG